MVPASEAWTLIKPDSAGSPPGGCRAGLWPQLCWVRTTGCAPPGRRRSRGTPHFLCSRPTRDPGPFPSSLACLPGPALSSLGFRSHNSSELAAAHGLFSPTLFPRDRAKLLSAIQEELGIHEWTQRSSPGPSWRKGAVQRAQGQRDGQTDPALSPGQIPLVLCPGDSRLPPPGTSLARKGRLQQFPWALGSFGGRGPLLSWGCGPRQGPGLEGRETLQN